MSQTLLLFILKELLPPDPVYPLVEGITSEIVTSGKLSSLQLEGVLYAVSNKSINKYNPGEYGHSCFP